MYRVCTVALCHVWVEVEAEGPADAVDVASSSPRVDWRVGDLFADVDVLEGDPPDVVRIDGYGTELGA